MEREEKGHIACPFCGELNRQGSNICGRCFQRISDVANPERADFEETVHDAPRRPLKEPSPFELAKRWLLRTYRQLAFRLRRR
ncbi:MAG: hypothetical protein JXR96_03685 [Deltaproteobacteria bacterium]|nr:hypothetical protein [Deltaproteobacteria bacterium]